MTGAASGIGTAVTRWMTHEGATVIAVDKNEAGLRSVTMQLTSLGLDAPTVIVSDQTDEQTVTDLAEHSALRDGLDIAVLNAGIAARDTPFRDLDLSMWDRIHAVNTRGTVLMLQALLPALERRAPSCVVVTGSVSGLKPHCKAAAYASSKAALVSLVRTIALELAPAGVRVNSVLPGAVDTPLLHEIVGHGVIAQAHRANPLGQIAAPDDIAAAISFLCSDDARFVNATELVVDGGERWQ